MIYVTPVVIPFDLGIAVRAITVRLTRDGEQTAAIKVALLLDKALSVQAVFSTSHSAQQRFRASAVDSGWLVVAMDETPPARAGARYVQVNTDLIIAIDLNDGSGAGNSGAPALIGARVRVDGMPADREVVALDRAIDGAWKVAGSASAGASGEGPLDIRVTASGRVYVMSVDDWGVLYQSQLEVTAGQTIRPSQYSGWLYRITEPGTLPATEPQWWAAEGDNAPRLLGTARAIAVRYYQPLAHGPVPVEIL